MPMTGERPGPRDITPQKDGAVEKKWHERDALPGYARIQYLLEKGAEPITVADVPITSLLRYSYESVTSSSSLTVVVRNTDFDPVDPYISLACYLKDLYDPNYHIPGLIVPDDSPIRDLPGIKYELPPKQGVTRVAVTLSDAERSRLQSRFPDNHYGIGSRFTIAEISDEKTTEMTTFFREEIDRFKASDPEVHKHSNPAFDRVVTLFRETIKGRRQPMEIDTATLKQFGITPDPEAPGHEEFMASQR